MRFNIKMGVPEMAELWQRLQYEYRNNSISKEDETLYKKWGQALKHLSISPKYPGLESHNIDVLSNKYGMKVWQSYLENRNSSARRMFWVYGPDKRDITIVGLDPHPESKKNGAYERIGLSDLPRE
jgi:hypothetical protein